MNNPNNFQQPEKDDSAPTPEELTAMFGDDLPAIEKLEDTMGVIAGNKEVASELLGQSIENPHVPLTPKQRKEYNIANEQAEMAEQSATIDDGPKERRMDAARKWVRKFLTP